MFTGIVSELGTVLTTAPSEAGRRLEFDAPGTTDGLTVGDSVAVNGVCLTAVSVADGRFVVEAVRETLQRSNLGALEPGHRVDLERPTPTNGRFDGHVVQGHVDGLGTVAARTAEGEAERIRISIPADLARYVVEKGSVAVDGVSLTVTAVSPLAGTPEDAWFEVVLIPHTLDVTVLGRRTVGDNVNIEVDVLAKYVERILEAQS